MSLAKVSFWPNCNLGEKYIYHEKLFHFNRGVEDKRLILNTLPISHYVDKVRWCMDKAKIPYEEEKDIGIFWVSVTSVVEFCGRESIGSRF